MSVDGSPNPESQTLIGIARSFATTNLGVSDPSLLANDFICSGPSFNGIDKKSYVAGLTKETAVFQRAIPDFDLRPYSFTVDETQPDTVWFKIRPRGTITGQFAYKGEVYSPNTKVIEMPAQQLSVTIRSGQITRVTAGYIIDRFTGNTGGLAGPSAVLYALGESPSKFSYIPPAVVIRQFFQRTKKLVQRKAVKVSPFPVAVMVSLAKRVVETSLGAEEESLLSSDFQFSGPLVGPLGKPEFLGALKSFNLKASFPDLKTEACCYEVDSYDPERVWVTSRGTGTQTGPLVLGGKVVAESTGNSYVGAPEAVSVSFNEQGLCYRATAGYVLDKEQGNTKGLGGVYGILEAVGCPLPWWESRTIDELPGLIKESLFQSAPAPVPIKKNLSPAPSPVLVAKEIPAPKEMFAPAADVKEVEPTAMKIPATKPVPAKPVPAKSVPAKVTQPKVIPTSTKEEGVRIPAVSKATVEKVDDGEKKGFLSFLNPPSPVKKATVSVAQSMQADTSSVIAPTVKKTMAAPAQPKNVPPTPVPMKLQDSKIEKSQKVIVSTIVPEPTKTPVTVKPKSGGIFSMKMSKGSMGEKKVPIVTPPPEIEILSKASEKPKPAGGMFSMKISQGSTGKLSTGLNAKKNVSSDVKSSK